MNKHVIDSVKEFLKENYDLDLSEIEIHRNYSTYEILDMYLGWEGIYGYTNDIYSIFGNRE